MKQLIINNEELKELFILYSRQKDIFVCSSPFAFKRIIKPFKEDFKHYQIDYQALFWANLFITSFIHANSIKSFLELGTFLNVNRTSKTTLETFSKNHRFVNKPYITQFAPKLLAKDVYCMFYLYRILKLKSND